METTTAMSQAFQAQLISLVCEGVFEEFPELRVVLLEGGLGWLPSLIWRLNKCWPGMCDRLCSSSGGIRQHINIFVDGERARLETELRPGAVVRIIPAVSGG